MLLENLRSYDSEEQRKAVNKFKELGRDRGTRYALALLLDKSLEDYRVQVVLARVLSDWRDRRSIEFLFQYLYYPDAGAARIAAEGLMVFKGDEDLNAALVAKLDSPVIVDRRRTADVLLKTGDAKAAEKVAGLYRGEEDREIRARYLMILRATKHPERLRFLVDALTDSDEGLRGFAWSLVKPKVDTNLSFNPAASLEQRANDLARIRLSMKAEP